MGDAPDIVVGFNPGYRVSWQTAVGGFTKDIITDNTKKWKGDHLVDPAFVPGILISNAHIEGDSATQQDIVPTVLTILGVEIPTALDGRSLLQ